MEMINVKTEPPKKRKLYIQDEDTEFVACERLKEPRENEYDIIAKVWALELQKMSQEQQIYAKKAIHDVIFEGQLGNLHRHSIQFNNTDLNGSSLSCTPSSTLNYCRGHSPQQ